MDLERNSLGLGGKSALIVVDMINGFTDPACPLGCACPEVVAAMAGHVLATAELIGLYAINPDV